MPIANARYIRNREKPRKVKGANGRRGRTQHGVNVTRGASRRVWYCSYEPGTVGKRGQWYDPTSAPQSYQEVQEWAKQGAAEHPYTYTLILSTTAGTRAAPEHFTQVMQESGTFADWRLIEHTDKVNYHAHVITFTDRTLRRGELMEWQQAACERLKEIEQQLAREQAREAMREQMMEGGLEL